MFCSTQICSFRACSRDSPYSQRAKDCIMGSSVVTLLSWGCTCGRGRPLAGVRSTASRSGLDDLSHGWLGRCDSLSPAPPPPTPPPAAGAQGGTHRLKRLEGQPELGLGAVLLGSQGRRVHPRLGAAHLGLAPAASTRVSWLKLAQRRPGLTPDTHPPPPGWYRTCGLLHAAPRRPGQTRQAARVPWCLLDLHWPPGCAVPGSPCWPTCALPVHGAAGCESTAGSCFARPAASQRRRCPGQ